MSVASADLLRATIEDDDGAIVETWAIASPYTYQLGSRLTPPIPPTWHAIPRGSFPIPAPTAPTTPSTITAAGGLLDNLQYRWALTYSTRWGETLAGPELVYTVTASSSYGHFDLPALPSIPDNPIVAINVYRSTGGGASGTKGLVGRITDLANPSLLTAYTDGLPDSLIGPAPPSADSSGITAAVVVTGPLAAGGSGPWTQVADRLGVVATEEYAVDYTYPNGGVVTFAAADVAKTVTLTSVVSIMDDAPLMNSLITAIKDTATTVNSLAGISSPSFTVMTVNAFTAIVVSDEDYDTDGYHAPATAIFTIPADGIYRLWGQAEWAGPVGKTLGVLDLTILSTDLGVIGQSTLPAFTVSTNPATVFQQVVAVRSLTAGDQIFLEGRPKAESGTAGGITVQAGARMTIERIG